MYDALRAGASGFLLKEAPPEQLVAGVRTVAAGEQLLAPSVTRRLIERFTLQPPPAEPSPVEELTPRELEVLRLVARALTNAEIAAHLFLSETTVKTHVARILMELGLRDRVQAVVLAYERGLASARLGRLEPFERPTSTAPLIRDLRHHPRPVRQGRARRPITVSADEGLLRRGAGLSFSGSDE